MGKHKDDCTPEEWEKILEKQRQYRKNMSIEKKEQYKKNRREYDRKYKANLPKDHRKLEYQREKEKRIAFENSLSEDERAKIIEERKAHRREINKRYLSKNKERLKVYKQEYYKKHPGKYRSSKESAKKYYEKHKEKYKQYYRRYNEDHKDEIYERRRNHRLKHMDVYRERAIRNANTRKNKYILWAKKLSIDEDAICDEKGYILVRDYNTKEYFYPTKKQLSYRVRCLNGQSRGEMHLYKNEESKKSCRVYNQKKYIKGSLQQQKSLMSRDGAWRDMVISRAEGHCEKCGKECDSLIAHHKVPVATCAMMAADIDNGMALCPECHKEVHSTDGCRLHELAAEKRETV